MQVQTPPQASGTELIPKLDPLSLSDNLKVDLQRYTKSLNVLKIIENPAAWAVIWYRYGRWVYHGHCPKIIQLPCKLLYLLINKCFFEIVLEMFLDVSADIGPGLHIGHIGGVHINPEAKIGKNCSLAHQVTIGTSALGRRGAPTIGDNVYIGVGAKIIGKIKVGDNANIAANSLVMSNIPARSTVIGVPGRVVMQKLASEFEEVENG